MARANRDRVADLTRLILDHEEKWMRTEEAPRVEVDDDHMEALKAMGYVEDEEEEEAPQE